MNFSCLIIKHMNYGVPSFSFEIPFLKNISIESVASIVFFLVIFFIGIVSIIMFYHWKKYGFLNKTFIVTEIIYFSVVVLLVSTAFVGLK